MLYVPGRGELLLLRFRVLALWDRIYRELCHLDLRGLRFEAVCSGSIFFSPVGCSVGLECMIFRAESVEIVLGIGNKGNI